MKNRQCLVCGKKLLSYQNKYCGFPCRNIGVNYKQLNKEYIDGNIATYSEEFVREHKELFFVPVNKI